MKQHLRETATLAGFARGCFDLALIVFALVVPPVAVVQLYLAITG